MKELELKLTSVQEVKQFKIFIKNCVTCNCFGGSWLTNCLLPLVKELCSSRDAAAANEERLSAELSTVSAIII